MQEQNSNSQNDKIKPSQLTIWLLAIRPKTLSASIVPVVIGLTIASKNTTLSLLTSTIVITCAMMIQITCNLANDWLDFKKGTDKDRIGPTRVTQAGLVITKQIFYATLTSILICLLLGSYLVFIGGWPILIIGTLSIAFAVLYTATSYSLSYLGLGELFVLVFFGPIATCGTVFLFQKNFSLDAFIAGISCGLISSAILAANNLRDIASDAKSNKKTLAVRFGEKFARAEYCYLVISANFLALVFGVITLNLSSISCLSLLANIKAIKSVIAGAKGIELIAVLEQTAKSLLVFGVLYSIGYGLS